MQLKTIRSKLLQSFDQITGRNNHFYDGTRHPFMQLLGHNVCNHFVIIMCKTPYLWPLAHIYGLWPILMVLGTKIRTIASWTLITMDGTRNSGQTVRKTVFRRTTPLRQVVATVCMTTPCRFRYDSTHGSDAAIMSEEYHTSANDD